MQGTEWRIVCLCSFDPLTKNMFVFVSRVMTLTSQQQMRKKLYTNSRIIPELLWEGRRGPDLNRLPENSLSLARPGKACETQQHPAFQPFERLEGFVHVFVRLSLFENREKLYEEKLRQQKQELKQLHMERQRLFEIQGKIQDLQWACPDLQVSQSTRSA